MPRSIQNSPGRKATLLRGIPAWVKGNRIDSLQEESQGPGGARRLRLRVEIKNDSHEGHEVSRRISTATFPSCDFVSFVVDGLFPATLRSLASRRGRR